MSVMFHPTRATREDAFIARLTTTTQCTRAWHLAFHLRAYSLLNRITRRDRELVEIMLTEARLVIEQSA